MTLSTKQAEAANLLNTKAYTLLYGGARSGKTYLIIYWIVVRALVFAGCRQLVTRRYAVDVRGSIWKITIRDIIKELGLIQGQDYTVNEQEMELRFPNGSIVLCSGLDDKERVDKVLGQEYTAIYVNESQDVSWSTVRTLRTRLSQRVKGCSIRFVADLNPTSSAHWTYKVFFKGLDPETGDPIPGPELYGKLKLSPKDNEAHLPADYIRNELESLTGSRRQRFLEGEYTSLSDLQVFNPASLYHWQEFEDWSKGRLPDVRMVGGIDIGFEDADSVCVLAYIDGDPNVWLVFEHKARRASVTELGLAVEKAKAFCRENIKNGGQDIIFFGDTGGGGKKILWELTRVQGIPIRPAYKQEKKMAIELLQDEVNTGRFHIPAGGTFFDECGQIVFTREDNGDILRIVDDSAYHPDMMDAILYAYRYLWAYGNNALRKEFRDERSE